MASSEAFHMICLIRDFGQNFDHPIIFCEVSVQRLKGYLPILTKQIHDPVINPIRHCIVEIPVINSLGDVLGKWPIVEDPVEQFFSMVFMGIQQRG